jgi:hypothetical protein
MTLETYVIITPAIAARATDRGTYVQLSPLELGRIRKQGPETTREALRRVYPDACVYHIGRRPE